MTTPTNTKAKLKKQVLKEPTNKSYGIGVTDKLHKESGADLEECPTCGGLSKDITNTEVAQDLKEVLDDTNEDKRFYYPSILSSSVWVSCSHNSFTIKGWIFKKFKCDGCGKVFNRSGYKLLQFIKRSRINQ